MKKINRKKCASITTTVVVAMILSAFHIWVVA